MFESFDFQQMISAFIVLFAVIDIIGSIPIIINLKEKGKDVNAMKATVISFLLMIGFFYAGDVLLRLFHVDIESFAVAGSFVIFLLSLEMILDIEIFKNQGPIKEATLVPLVFPLLAGAGSFTTLLSLRAEYANVNIVIALILNMIWVYFVVRMTARIERFFGKGGIYIPDGVPEKHLRIGEIVKKKYGLKVLKFKNAKEIMPYARPVFHTLNAAFAPLYGFAQLTEKQIDYYINMYIPMLRYDLVTLIVREEDNAVVGFGISLPNLSRALQKARGHMLPFGWIHLLKALKSKPKVIDLYLTGVLPEYQSKGVNALLFNDLIPVYKRIGAVYAESNPELETNSAVQAQWDYFKREHHKSRRAYIKKL